MKTPDSGWHAALLYTNPTQYVDAVLRFVDDALAAARPVLVAVPAEHGELVRANLGGRQVRFADMGRLGRNPSRIIPAFQAFVDEHHGPVSFVSEPIWTGRSAAEVAEATRHEALINATALAAHGTRILCPYDAGALDPAVVADAYRTHREYVDDDGQLHPSPDYADPHQVWSDTVAMPPAPADAEILRVTRAELSALRQLIRRTTTASGLSAWRSENLLIAVNELVTNSLCHGGGTAAVSMWADSGRVICDVQDAGVIDDPLVGCSRPPVHGTSGRGLWLVNQLCDLVQLHSSTIGTRVRVTL